MVSVPHSMNDIRLTFAVVENNASQKNSLPVTDFGTFKSI